MKLNKCLWFPIALIILLFIHLNGAYGQEHFPYNVQSGDTLDVVTFKKIVSNCRSSSIGFNTYYQNLIKDQSMINVKIEHNSEVMIGTPWNPHNYQPEFRLDIGDLETFPNSIGIGTIPKWATSNCALIAHETSEAFIFRREFVPKGPNEDWLKFRDRAKNLRTEAHFKAIKVENDIRFAEGTTAVRKHYCTLTEKSTGIESMMMIIGNNTEVIAWKNSNILSISYYEQNMFCAEKGMEIKY